MNPLFKRKRTVSALPDFRDSITPPGSPLAAGQIDIRDLLKTHGYFLQLKTFFDGPLRRMGSSLEHILTVSRATLDAGCGDGVCVSALQRAGLNVYGVDLSEILELARQNCPNPEKIVAADVRSLQPEDPRLGGQNFDLVISRTLFASSDKVVFDQLLLNWHTEKVLPDLAKIQFEMIGGIANTMNRGANWLLYDNKSLQTIPNQAFQACGLQIKFDNKAHGVMILEKI